MNPLYQMLTGGMPGAQTGNASPMSRVGANPIAQIGTIMQAMRNPAGFVKNAFPDIPDQIMNDPNQIIQYLQRTRGITGEQIGQMIQQAQGMGWR